MPNTLKKTILAIGVVAGISAAPIIPQDMELLYSYQTTYEAQFEPVPEEFAESFKPPIMEDVNGDGIISASVFADRKGNRVYTQIDEVKYRDMGKKGGIVHNPTKNEFISAFELTTPKVEAAIAFDAATNPALASATSLTFAHTNTGSDRILFVGAFIRNQIPSSVVYNAAAMTEIGSREGPQGGANDYISLYYLVGGATGSNNVVITIPSSAVIIGGAVSYTGASQTGQPDNSANNDTTVETTTTTTLTTVADNSWLMGMCRAGTSGSTSAGSGTTQRANTAGYFQMYDKNGAVTPAGSASIICTQSSQTTMAKIASFSPATGGGGGPTLIRESSWKDE